MSDKPMMRRVRETANAEIHMPHLHEKLHGDPGLWFRTDFDPATEKPCTTTNSTWMNRHRRDTDG